jgi:hypothetical protein
MPGALRETDEVALRRLERCEALGWSEPQPLAQLRVVDIVGPREIEAVSGRPHEALERRSSGI